MPSTLTKKQTSRGNPHPNTPRHSKIWHHTAQKGITLHNAMANSPLSLADKAPLHSFTQTYDFAPPCPSIPPTTTPFPELIPFIKAATGAANSPHRPTTAGGTTYTNLRWYWPKGPTSSATATFWNTISAADGVIIAFSNYRGGDSDIDDPNNSEPKNPHHWSDMLWTLWLQECARFDKPPHSLRQIYRHNVESDDGVSVAVIREALRGRRDEVVTFMPDRGRDVGNAFWALLGYPNGVGLGFLVGEHRRALRGRGLVSLSVFFDGRSGEFYLWGTIG